MTAESLLEAHHVVRYIKPAFIRTDGTVDASAFVLGEGETGGISVNWLEFFGDDDPSRNINRIRKCIHLNLAKNARFAKLNVGETILSVFNETKRMGTATKLDFVKKPSPATERHDQPDLSHAEIEGVPNKFDSELADDLAMFVGQSIARCVKMPLYPARE